MFSYDVITFILFIFLIIISAPIVIVITIGTYYFCFLGIFAMIEEIAEQIERIKIKKNKKIFKKVLTNKQKHDIINM